MNLGADDYVVKPATASELLAAIDARFKREAARPPGKFNPDFSSPAPLLALGLTEREAEVLLWVAQGKSNPEIGSILGAAENTVKKHLQNIFEKLGIESRNAATVRALEALSRPAGGR
jgi:DNA-binding NarL/FixJ family response regulator